MWLAIAQPSSSMKCRNASAASRTDRLRARNGYSLQAAAIQIVYCCTLCKPGLGALRHCSAAKLCRLHVGEELTDLRASVVTPATRLIASAPTRASPEARLTPSAIDATALLKSRLELASAWDCVTVAKARPTSPSPETYVTPLARKPATGMRARTTMRVRTEKEASIRASQLNGSARSMDRMLVRSRASGCHRAEVMM